MKLGKETTKELIKELEKITTKKEKIGLYTLYTAVSNVMYNHEKSFNTMINFGKKITKKEEKTIDEILSLRIKLIRI